MYSKLTYLLILYRKNLYESLVYGPQEVVKAPRSIYHSIDTDTQELGGGLQGEAAPPLCCLVYVVIH